MHPENNVPKRNVPFSCKKETTENTNKVDRLKMLFPNPKTKQ